MLRTIAEYGLLATILLLVILVGEYALFLKPSVSSWLVGGAAAVVLAVGLWLGKRHFGEPHPHSGSERRASPIPANPHELDERRAQFGISDREYEVLVLVAEGLSNQEIAERLFIAETTVKSHVSSLLAKLEARRRTEAVSRAMDAGLL